MALRKTIMRPSHSGTSGGAPVCDAGARWEDPGSDPHPPAHVHGAYRHTRWADLAYGRLGVRSCKAWLCRRSFLSFLAKISYDFDYPFQGQIPKKERFAKKLH